MKTNKKNQKNEWNKSYKIDDVSKNLKNDNKSCVDNYQGTNLNEKEFKELMPSIYEFLNTENDFTTQIKIINDEICDIFEKSYPDIKVEKNGLSLTVPQSHMKRFNIVVEECFNKRGVNLDDRLEKLKDIKANFENKNNQNRKIKFENDCVNNHKKFENGYISRKSFEKNNEMLINDYFDNMSDKEFNSIVDLMPKDLYDDMLKSFK